MKNHEIRSTKHFFLFFAFIFNRMRGGVWCVRSLLQPTSLYCNQLVPIATKEGPKRVITPKLGSIATKNQSKLHCFGRKRFHGHKRTHSWAMFSMVAIGPKSPDDCGNLQILVILHYSTLFLILS